MPAVVLPDVRLLLILLLFAGVNANATDYYVSSSYGSDASSGISPEAPWQSIARVNHFKFEPGDRILLHVGEVWREQLRPPSSGAPGLPIVFSSYGLGERPILEGEIGRGLKRFNGAAKLSQDPTHGGDVAIDNNDQSHILYEGLELRHVLEGLRIYVWSAAVTDIALQNCQIQVDAAEPNHPPSSAVYANVRTGAIADLRILNNHLIPYPRGLEHWGIYFVGGVQHFQIEGNTLGPAGEDGITIWHSAFGEIRRNQGGGNGENTIDVKDSHDIVMAENAADLDREYNIVVHSVDTSDGTYKVLVAGNHCSRGGQGGQLSAGIALLLVRESGVENNFVESAFGAGILIKDAGVQPGNWAEHNRLNGNGSRQKLPAIVLQGTATARVEGNEISLLGDARSRDACPCAKP
jgi:hypothetical protein